MKRSWGVCFPLFATLAAFSSKSSINAESCDKNFNLIQSFPDGYRARLLLPVLEKTTEWKAGIVFDKSITTFDTADGNLEGGKKTGVQFNVTNYRHNGNLNRGSTFRLEFIVHYPRNIVPAPKIQKIQFGKFSCRAEETTNTGGCVLNDNLPTCYSLAKKNNQWPDGFTAKLELPIKKSVQSWTLLLIFNKPIRVLNFPDGQILATRNSTEFTIKNRDYNEKLSNGKKVRFDFTVHYARGQKNTNLVAVIFDPVQFVCVATEFKSTLVDRYRNAQENGNKIVPLGADWLASCKEAVPECTKRFLVRDSWPDGVRGFLRIPVKENVNGWNVTLFFDPKITTLDVNQGDKVISRDSVYFVVRNHSYNARLSAGTFLNFEITIHFPRDKRPRPQLTIAKFRNEVICEDTDNDCAD